ncbi:transposase for insertion sequence element IS402 family protein [Leptospira kirschneri serovar Cynopteri str. 3522 CT]|nr:transposase for insertion sequence element IS402 family protein [Leptospira kirschneri serovar Grippotyphosa str. RM52]EKQ82078.1 transposase for insertion sequence element IS402 family protein [Leptospira kirschneri serovar Grippotyphosa str. Moskva]EKR10182.1 transposase for insertion sequence element IS402 family protein [Leptospira kirschneri serovar Valbuzzi str. 200702274]EMK07447.1 transposase for insertion sequence element IS402 family protein [Leptospira kirschneri str. MMD1493]EMN0
MAITLTGANVHDKHGVKDTLNSILIFSGKRRNIQSHIRKKGEKPLIGKYKGKPRRWVVERTNSWHNRFRAILIRWERKSENYLASLYLASSIIAFNFFDR